MKTWLVVCLALLTTVVALKPGRVYAANSIIELVNCDVTDPSTGKIKQICSDPNDPATCQSQTCGVADFVNLFVYLAQWGLIILSVLAVLMFVWGGFQFVTAGGRASKVDEGKRIVGGTIIGIMIALSAYVIINFAVTSITGTTLKTYNPFAGPIASVFGQGKYSGLDVNIQRPFSGGGSGTDTRSDCRSSNSGWDKSCGGGTLQEYCADPNTGSGDIQVMQAKLNAQQCNCGNVDGCFGGSTVACVRRFQIANGLPPSGVVDGTTRSYITGDHAGAASPCGSIDSKVSPLLPGPITTSAGGTNTGCCVVSDDSDPLYCLDNVSHRACNSLGGPSGTSQFYDSSSYCASVPDAAGQCGFCSTVNQPHLVQRSFCFQYTSSHWCDIANSNKTTTTYNGQPYSWSYNSGGCDGSCSSCVKSLLFDPR